MSSSFAFIPRAVKKKNHSTVSSHAPSENISVGAQVTSGSIFRVNNPNLTRTKDLASTSESIKNIEDDDDEDASRSITATKPFEATVASRRDLLELEDLAQLVCLALSDYAIWADVDLRRKIDWENNQDAYDNDTDLQQDTVIDEDERGYIPLAYLLQHSQVFRLVSSSSSSIISQPQTTFTKAIRTHVPHLIDVRLIIPSSSSTFARKNTTQWSKPHIQTGYELKRKGTSSALSKHGKKEWDALTIYVENIPYQYRSIQGIIRFLNGLLPTLSSFSSSSISRIQNISLPSHHLDQPNSIPACKGFALATLSHDEDAIALLKAWSWDHPMGAKNSDRTTENDVKSTISTKGQGKSNEHLDDEISYFHVEAAKFGLRVLTKAKWEELRAEYLLYRQELVDEINAFQDEVESEIYGGGRKREYGDETYSREEQITGEFSNPIRVQKSANIQSQPSNIATIDNSIGIAGIHPNSAYPPGCLVFIRNVYPDTNKTILRSLFLHARGPDVENGIEGGKKDDDGLDYLDYIKGMDCCHVRLRTPLHARQLVHYLSSKPIVQTSGSDASGTSFVGLSPSDKDKSQLKPIIAEQVLGKREEVYWEKVPDKIRRQAVEKALSLLHSSNSSIVGSGSSAGLSEGDTKKKRELEEHQTRRVDINIHANSAHPPGCLVFIHNVHPETNKTTLRNLFLHAREEGMERGPGGKKDEDWIDYLDYTKGMDSCHVRLRTPLHTQQFVHHLSSSLIVQTTGLDASGSRLENSSASPSELKPLVAEQVLGKREEVYWEKVPEKVRRQAVEKALSFLHDGGSRSRTLNVEVSEGGKSKKRRKK